MSDISILFSVIVGFYVIVSLCGASSLVLDIYARKNNIDKVPLYSTILYKIFNIAHLPLALVSIIVSVIDQIENQDGTLLILLSVFIIISLACIIIRGFWDMEYHNTGVIAAGSEYNHVYKAASNYYDAKTERANICQKTIEKFNTLVEEINNHLIAVNSTYSGIGDYMQIQKD